jgi:diguanylate cyclase (GGDEF)-like protein
MPARANEGTQEKGFWRRPLNVTAKFSLGFGLLFLVIILEVVLGYRTLEAMLAANAQLAEIGNMQRLTAGMDRNWKVVQQLEVSYFLQIDHLGAEQAYELYALPAGAKITEVIRDAAVLKQLLADLPPSGFSTAGDAHLQALLADLSQYVTLFEQTAVLENQVWSSRNGLVLDLAGEAEQISGLIGAQDLARLVDPYYRLRLREIAFLSNPDPATLEALRAAVDALQAGAAELPDNQGERGALLGAIDRYRLLVEEIWLVDAQIRAGVNAAAALDHAIEVSILDLLVQVDEGQALARLAAEETGRQALIFMGTVAFSGLVFALWVARFMHRNVTRHIVKLNQVASRFRSGDFDVRAEIKSGDEIGQLATTFNEMAGTVRSFTAELREQATRDHLTGLFNRHYLFSSLPRELVLADQRSLPVSLVMIDIDNFKQTNDQHGHAAGDDLLAALGRLLTRSTRLNDIACRFGGDELVVVLIGVRLEHAAARAEGWRQEFSRLAHAAEQGPIRSTLSVGVVERKPGEDVADCIARADQALYQAKRQGRNQVGPLPGE